MSHEKRAISLGGSCAPPSTHALLLVLFFAEVVVNLHTSMLLRIYGRRRGFLQFRPKRLFSVSSKDRNRNSSLIKRGLESTLHMVKNPSSTITMIRDTVNHYYVGSKLLWSEIKMASQILIRVLQGSSMTRRERMQLIRTTTDIFRLVPFSIFVIVSESSTYFLFGH